jgi:hypothetical protein
MHAFVSLLDAPGAIRLKATRAPALLKDVEDLLLDEDNDPRIVEQKDGHGDEPCAQAVEEDEDQERRRQGEIDLRQG